MADPLLERHPLRDVFGGPVADLMPWARRAKTINHGYRRLCAAADEFGDPGPAGYIYVLGHADVHTRQVYVGKTVNPLQRFQAHRRRPWWGRVEYARVYMMDCRWHERCDARAIDRALIGWESLHIDILEPDANLFLPAHVPSGVV